MRKKYFIILAVIFLGISLVSQNTKPDFKELKTINNRVKTPADSNPGIEYGKIPLYFIPNEGQVNRDAGFYAKASRYTLWMTKSGLVFDTLKKNKSERKRDISRLLFVGSEKNPQMVPVDITNHTVNYMIGSDKSKWRCGIKTSKAVLYKSLYHKIDLKVYGIEKKVEYDWNVKPGGDPALIRFHYKNCGMKEQSTRLDSHGNLLVKTGFGELMHTRPVGFQVIDGKRVAVEVVYKKFENNTYGFRTGNYNPEYALIIDPITLAYSTFVGGTSDDQGYAIAVSSTGSAYVTGKTYSTDYPTTSGTLHETSRGGESDAFVTKISSDGTSLIYSTYLGGSGLDTGEDIVSDSLGRAYITGRTASTDFPGTSSYYQPTYGGGDYDAFIVKLSASGSTFKYATYLGGTGWDLGYGIAIDSSENVYVCGHTNGTDFPTVNPYQTSIAGGTYDTFVTKLASNGGSLTYSTYLGGTGRETAFAIKVDSSNNAYITGSTGSTDFPVHNAYQATTGGGTYDIFLTKFSTAGTGLVYSTYLGSTGDDVAWSIAVDSGNCAYVAGDTTGSDFPTSNPYQGTFGGGSKDGIIAKFSNDGSALTYATYLGGGEDDAISLIAVDSNSKAHVTGFTKSTNFPLSRAYQSAYNGGFDSFATVFNAAGSDLVFSTYFGGGGDDYGRGLAVDSSGNTYVTGYSDSSDFPTSSAYQNTISGGDDVVVAKFETANLDSLGEALDNSTLTWTTGGDADWFSQGDTYYYDDDAAQSGSIGNSDDSFLQTTTTGAGTLSFRWRVSSESGYDYLQFYIDDELQQGIAGSTGSWEQKTYTLTAGSHTLKWNYHKDGSVSSGADCGWVDQVQFTPDTTFTLDRDVLNFGAVGGTASATQYVYLNASGYSSVTWTAVANQEWIQISPTTGVGSGAISISTDVTALAPGSYAGTLTVTDTSSSSSDTVTVNLTLYGSGQSDPPFGNYSTPIDGSTVSSSVPFTGWALDDIGIDSVKLYREDDGDLQFIGDALFVDGARPDVEASYPGYPDNYKAGWGYMMLTNFLPNGNGTFNIHAIATDFEGNQITLGIKTITVDNANAVKPFGAIDTPAPGGIALGSEYRNNGWVLTPMPNSIATDGSTITVYVDGVSLGQPVYNVYRPDIAALFPGYANSDGAHAYLDFDTTTYSAGIHSIFWVVTDSDSNSDGIGSRYFTIQNPGGVTLNSMSNRSPLNPAALDVADLPINNSASVTFFKQYSSLPHTATPEKGAVHIDITELDRLEVQFKEPGDLSRLTAGYIAVGHMLKPLPTGSTLDLKKGAFYWQPGPGFSGLYKLIFIETSSSGSQSKRILLINILPKFSGNNFQIR